MRRNKFKKIIFSIHIGLFLFINIANVQGSQSQTIDSLVNILNNTTQDSTKVTILNALALEFVYINPDTAIYFANKSFALSKAINFQLGLADSYLCIGIWELENARYEEATKKIRISLDIYNRILVSKRKIDLPYILKQKSIAYNNIGRIYFRKGDYPQALYSYFTALKIREDIHDKKGIATTLTNIGLIYFRQNNYLEALRNYFEALQIRKEIGINDGIASSYSTIGMVYTELSNFEDAEKYFANALKLFEQEEDYDGIANCKMSIGHIYFLKGNYEKALKLNFEALTVNSKLGFKRGIGVSYSSIGELYVHQKNFPKAANYLNKALAIAKEINNLESIKEIYGLFARSDSSKGDYKMALTDYKLFIVYRDSLLNLENTKKLLQSQLKYDYDKQQTIAKDEQRKKDIIADAERRRQGIILISILGGLLLTISFLIIILRALSLVKKQRLIIAEKNKDITDSITYAKRIQQAKLPELKNISQAFPDSFVLFKPKDIVSGDFYFFFKNEHHSYIAACDCTGHGVPGVIMSMIGSEKLFEAVSISDNPSEILKRINNGIKASLRQNENIDSTRDGMDIALCSVSNDMRTLIYSGANRPFWLIRNGKVEIEEIKSTKYAIGGYTDNNQEFLSHEIKLQAGDTFYIFTDGFADTFNGANDKKLTTKKFKEVLLQIQDKNLQEQHEYLDQFIEKWKAGTEQVDDILVIGVRV